MRLIDADALITSIKKQAGILRLLNSESMLQQANIMEFGFCEMVDNAPTIELQKWIPCSKRLPKQQ